MLGIVLHTHTIYKVPLDSKTHCDEWDGMSKTYMNNQVVRIMRKRFSVRLNPQKTKIYFTNTNFVIVRWSFVLVMPKIFQIFNSPCMQKVQSFISRKSGNLYLAEICYKTNGL